MDIAYFNITYQYRISEKTHSHPHSQFYTCTQLNDEEGFHIDSHNIQGVWKTLRSLSTCGTR